MDDKTIRVSYKYVNNEYNFNEEKETIINKKYKILGEELSLGGESDVFLCEDIYSKQKYIIKIYRKNLKPKKEVLTTLKNMEHYNIISLIDYGVFNNRFFEVVEYAEGGTLAQYMPFSEECISNILPQIIEGINFLHEKGIVHRDIKPENIFYKDNAHNKIVIGDFGISSICEEETHQTTSTKFTLDFAAPELSTNIFGKEVDYYALGITILYLLLGRSPFAGMEMQKIINVHSNEDIIIPENYSERIKNLIRGLLCKDKNKRWGYNEVKRWLLGENINLYEYKELFYYKFDENKEVYSIKSLANTMYNDEYNAKHHIARGFLYNGIKLYNEELAYKVNKIQQESYSIQEAYERIIYLLNPMAPYKISNDLVAYTPEELVFLADKSKELWDITCEKLHSGSIMWWLEGCGYNKIVHNWNKIRQKFFNDNGDYDFNAALEEFSHTICNIMDIKNKIPYPTIDVDVKEINIKMQEKELNIPITIENNGRGYLYGTIEIEKEIQGMELSKNNFAINTKEKKEECINLKIIKEDLLLNKEIKTDIIIKSNSNSEDIIIPIKVSVNFPVKTALIKSLSTSFVFILIFLAFQYLLVSPIVGFKNSDFSQKYTERYSLPTPTPNDVFKHIKKSSNIKKYLAFKNFDEIKEELKNKKVINKFKNTKKIVNKLLIVFEYIISVIISLIMIFIEFILKFIAKIVSNIFIYILALIYSPFAYIFLLFQNLVKVGDSVFSLTILGTLLGGTIGFNKVCTENNILYYKHIERYIFCVIMILLFFINKPWMPYKNVIPFKNLFM
ncbi:serine/threonine-protein kinase PrkC [Clostridium acetireducens DSM 10703]|uniref:Serine/threonine-protein kinase PrkC n=1 Tax=Clostridium acetireducens DSM 10703 TaxID=1121290 RepID=A0A1E8F188_9CLOT|nr:serine/threonine-protein kinase [Clostridium acetireducens]OFI07190.1 serine/threonine-protein kinase PrkC [Clostridium acetireducens DSM 10703]